MEHYTSIEGFEGIIKTKNLRMTKSDFLNDPSDCKLFNLLVQDYLQRNQTKVKSILSSVVPNGFVRELAEKYSVSDYIVYVQQHIPIYVLSLTELEDDMSMWNYYGHGGVELQLDCPSLIENFRSSLTRNDEYLTCSKVIYTNEQERLEDISVPVFESFELKSKDSCNLFAENRDSINNTTETSQLYSTESLVTFVDTYIKNYIYTIKFLADNNMIDSTTTQEELFEKVFANINALYGKYIWKKDLSLYILVLSALIKNSTYAYEKEYRIVYFENSLTNSKAIKEEYCVKSIGENKYLQPYICFRNINFDAIITKITLSPITKNLPINNDTYIRNVRDFVKNHQIGCEDVMCSKNKIRW